MDQPRRNPALIDECLRKALAEGDSAAALQAGRNLIDRVMTPAPLA